SRRLPMARAAKASNPAPKKTSPYSMHPAYRMSDAYRQNLEQRTGKTFEEWSAFAAAHGPKEWKARVEWLKKEHGLGTNYAAWVAAGDGTEAASYDVAAFVERQYAGTKAGLRRLYEEILELGLGLGDDVKACPCRTMVPLYRKYVFAE